MSTATDYDVVVVGCGPVGVTTAGLLAGRGLKVAAFDKDVELFPLPRAAHFDQEIMRVFQELGVADELAPSVIVNAGMDFLSADRDVLLSMRAADRTRSGWPSSLMFHQPGVEDAMRAGARRLGAELRLGEDVAGVADDGSMVTVSLAGGGSVTAAYVVACDGARSPIRKQLGIAMDDLQFEEPWLVVDLLLADGVAPPSPIALQVCDPARPHTLVPMPPPRYRFEFMLLPGETADDVNTPQRVEEFLRPWLAAGAATVERSAVYTFHGLIAEQWRSGRVFLAGDAAHQTPPFLGQGMCSGIRDAANLAWKLERVLRHGAADSLLDTYQTEREPSVRFIVGLAVELGRVICTLDPEVAAGRNAGMLAERAAGRGTSGEMGFPPLPAGLLCGDGGGQQAVQPTVSEVRLDDLVGPRFAVVARTDAALASDGAQWWQAAGAVLLSAEGHPELGPTLDAAEADTVVIRPDRYLLAAGVAVQKPSADAATLVGAGAG